jgi:hypothetical protein
VTSTATPSRRSSRELVAQVERLRQGVDAGAVGRVHRVHRLDRDRHAARARVVEDRAEAVADHVARAAQILRALREPARDDDEAPRLDRRGLVDRAQVVVDRGLAAFAVGRREESAAAQAGHRQAVVAKNARGFLCADLRQLVAPRTDAADVVPAAGLGRLTQVAFRAPSR